MLGRIKRRLFGARYHDGDGPLTLFRCTECGYLAFTRGGLHGHIEGHRPPWSFWRMGWDVDWLQERTERLRFWPEGG